MSRCLNCSVVTNRMRRHIVTSLRPQLQNTLTEWLSIQQLPSNRVICNACYILLNQCSEGGTRSRVLGYPMVCVGCGCSVMGRRYAVRHHTLEEISPLIDIFFSWNTHNQQDESENEIKVFCPKCASEVSHTAEGIQEDQKKILIAKVYHYFEQEYEELKTIYGDLDLTPLSKFRQRTALATGVSEAKILEILKEEEGRKADKREEPPEKRRRARKRSIQTESSSEEDSPDDNTDEDIPDDTVDEDIPDDNVDEDIPDDNVDEDIPDDNVDEDIPDDNVDEVIPDDNVDEDSPDDNADADEELNSLDEPQTLVVKVEPEHYNGEPEVFIPAAVKEEFSDIAVYKEQPQTDPIALNVNFHSVVLPQNDVLGNTNETLAPTKPAAIKRKGRKTPRSDVTSTRQQTQGESSTAAASSSDRLTEELDEDSLFGDTEMKTEEIEIYEEGPS